MQRYKVIIEYKGTKYKGMQKQLDISNTIQTQVEIALKKLIQRNIDISYASRTDAGVHAFGQVIHFDLDDDESLKYSSYNILHGANFFLTDEDIVFVSVEKVENNFHSRFDVKQKEYQYKIINRESSLAIYKDTHLHINKHLDINLMQEAANLFIGTYDFSSFRSANCENKNPIRSIDSIFITKNADEIIIQFKAKSFLHNMIRIMVGTLIEVGVKKIKVNQIIDIINQKNRIFAGKTASAHGLCLYNILY